MVRFLWITSHPPSLPISAGRHSMSTGPLMQCGVLWSLWLFKQFLLLSIIYLFFSVIDWGERCSEQFVFLCSSLEMEGQRKAQFLLILVCSFICLISMPYCAFSLCLCIFEGESEQEQLTHPGRKMERVNSCLLLLSQWMKAPCGSAQLWAEKLKQPKTYAHLGSGEEEKGRAGREEEEGKKCRAQDPVGSHLDHLANTLINKLPHTHAISHWDTVTSLSGLT